MPELRGFTADEFVKAGERAIANPGALDRFEQDALPLLRSLFWDQAEGALPEDHRCPKVLDEMLIQAIVAMNIAFALCEGREATDV